MLLVAVVVVGGGCGLGISPVIFLSNSRMKTSHVGSSKLVRRTFLRLRTKFYSLDTLTNFFRFAKTMFAHRSFGKPKLPVEMAGIETDSHLSSLALISVFMIALDSISTFLMLYSFRI